jgi:hypothetical protein
MGGGVQDGGGAPEDAREVGRGEVAQVDTAGDVRDALDAGVDTARGAGVVGQLLLLFREADGDFRDVFQVLERTAFESGGASVVGRVDLGLADECYTHGGSP